MLLLLVRHALCDVIGHSLAGRLPGVMLNAEGRAQAERLAAWLTPRPGDPSIGAVYASPLERTRETAEAIAARAGLAVRVSPALQEIDFGGWAGRDFTALRGDAHWRRFHTFRSATRPPGGELMLEVQLRVVEELGRWLELHGEAAVVAVTHGDVIRAAVGFFLGAPLDLYDRFAVDPASVTMVRVTLEGAQVLRLNASAARWPVGAGAA